MRLFSFVAPVLTGVVSPLLGVLSGGIAKADDGVKALAEMSTENPKKSGATALVLGWLGIDPSVVTDVGTWLITLGTWVQALTP